MYDVTSIRNKHRDISSVGYAVLRRLTIYPQRTMLPIQSGKTAAVDYYDRLAHYFSNFNLLGLMWQPTDYNGPLKASK